ncbi:molybdenum metabolism regulator [Bacillus sp. FMQ74]|nr:molybdenum metabolism regulator [Bacillus sp. FMQ74]
MIAQGKETFEKVLNDHEYLAAYITEETLDEEGYPQNEDLLSVAIEALTYMKTGNDEWDDEVHDELLDALEQKGLAESDGIELDWEEEDLPERFPKLWGRFGENPLF